ncbi:helix-turn-helix domain-containing protein, partial [Escherichia coli]|uniref:helix-turn-helix domain-containing protein n=2 Tax=Escherichia coli TaxID=562 RepID=UPI00321868D3
MKRLQAFKFQLRPGGQQEREMRRFAGACRFVFNRALALQNENHEAGNKYIPYPSRQPGGCGLSWSGITVIKKDNVIVFQVVIWPV